MRLLEVPYVQQFNNNACGAAVLEMIYRFYGFYNVSQQEIFETYSELEPHGSRNLRITTDNLVRDARSKGFNARRERVDYSNEKECITIIENFFAKGIPIIVCQKFTNAQPKIGHFRIVLGIDSSNVYLHDPNSEMEGPELKWPIKQFIDCWQPTGQNVIGGVYVIITKT